MTILSGDRVLQPLDLLFELSDLALLNIALAGNEASPRFEDVEEDMTEEAKEGRNAFVEKRKPDFARFPRLP